MEPGTSDTRHREPIAQGAATIVPCRFDLRGLRPAEQMEAYRSIAPVYSVGQRRAGRAPLDIVATFTPARDAILSRFASRAHRTGQASDSAARDRRFVKLRIYDRGGCRLFEGTRAVALGVGAVHLIDQSRPWTCEHDETGQTSVFLPHALIGYEPARHPVCISFGLDRPAGRVLGDAIRSFGSALPAATGAEAGALLAGFAGLVRGLLGGALAASRAPEVAAGRAASIRAYIAERLEDPELSVDAVCRDFRCARATVYRDFAETGGIAGYILESRLERAFRILAADPGTRGVVRTTAERFAFSSVSHFSEAFRRRFGVRPTEAIATAVVEPAAPAVVSPPPSRPDLEAAQRRLAQVFADFTGRCADLG